MQTIKMTGQLGYLIRRAQQLNGALWSQVVSGEITSLQFAALNCLRDHSDVDHKSLGALTSMDRSTTAELVTRMAKRGQIAIERDESDYRRRVLKLTPAGTALLNDLLPCVRKLSRILDKPLTSDEHRELKRLLSKFVNGLDETPA
jgi:DNA-binding MarR family transcriptional regulator